MGPKKFSNNDLVWAKMKGYPMWPGRITDPPAKLKSKPKPKHHCIFFFGSENYGFIKDELIVPHSRKMIPKLLKKKPAQFQKAVETILDLSEVKSQKKVGSKKKVESEQEEESDEEEKSKKEEESEKDSESEEVESEEEAKSAEVESEKEAESENEAESEEEVESSCSEAPSVVEVIDSDVEPMPSEEEVTNASERESRSKKQIKKQNVDKGKQSQQKADTPKTSYKRKNASPSPPKKISKKKAQTSHAPVYEISDNDDVIDIEETASGSTILGPIPFNPFRPGIIQPCSPEDLNLTTVSATTRKIGFIGLGSLGGILVKNLIFTGHNVTVWSRNPDQKSDFTKEGARWANTPADVVSACDVIFSCLCDSDVAKELFFGNCGIFHGLRHSPPGKAYVEMTAMDFEVVQKISIAVASTGGRFLEAFVQGTRKMAVEGATFIIAAGNLDVLRIATSCFHTIASQVMFIDRGVGCASKINLLFNAISSIMCTTLSESLVFLKKFKADHVYFLKFITGHNMCSDIVMEQAESMLEEDYSPGVPLKHFKKDLKIIVVQGRKLTQPTPMCAAALEILIQAEHMGYGDSDISAVHEVIKTF